MPGLLGQPDLLGYKDLLGLLGLMELRERMRPSLATRVLATLQVKRRQALATRHSIRTLLIFGLRMQRREPVLRLRLMA
jgi:hypothetical protein